MKSEILEPHWPSMLKFFERLARETRSKAKRAMFTEQANEIRAYLEANPDKAV